MQYLSIAHELKLKLDEKTFTNILLVLVTVLFTYGVIRMLCQWLVSNGVKMPEPVGKALFIKTEVPLQPYIKAEKSKKAFNTALIVIGVVLLSRIFVFVFAYLYRMQHDMHFGAQPYGFFDRFVETWNQWDAPHYLDIALDWFVGDKNVHNHLFIVFYPLYPFLMRACAVLAPSYLYPGFTWNTLSPLPFSDTGEFFFYSGCIISVICLCVGAVYFYRLAAAEYKKSTAIWALAFLLLNPANFFMNSVYTESLFVMLTVMCFYYLRKGKYVIAGVTGALAAFSKSLGVLLVVPFFIEWLDQESIIQKLKNKQPKEVLDLLRTKGTEIFIIPLGTLAYLFINELTFGNPLEFLDIQSAHWHQNFMFFLENTANLGARSLFYDSADAALQIWLPGFLMIMITMIAFTFGSGKKLRTSYLAYMMVYLVVGAAPSWLLSGARYFAMLFPLYFVMAESADKHKAWGVIMLALSIAAFLYLMCMHITGRQVM